MKIEIKHRIAGIVFTHETSADNPRPVRTAFLAAVAAYTDLSGGDLSGADLSGGDLSGADLSGAILSGADLSGADLSSANLSGADLSDADLSGACLARANLSDTNLSGTNLSGADLSGANLFDADLSDADLSRADLSFACLSRANLSDANLSDAGLSDANLSRADLSGGCLSRANLSDTDLSDTDLSDTDLSDANLSSADLSGALLSRANLSRANLSGTQNLPTAVVTVDPPTPYVRLVDSSAANRARRYRARHPEVPVVEQLDARILAEIDAGGRLRMSDWHTCRTTHCRAGWAITLAGKAGRRLEDEHGSARAGSMIYRASTGRVPWFYDPSDERALADIKRCAAVQAQPMEQAP